MRRLLQILLLLPLLSLPARSQPLLQGDDLRLRYGVFGDYNFNWHDADFRALPGVPNCCPRFVTGEGNGSTLGVLFEYPVWGRWLLDARASYSGIGATLSAREPTTVIKNGTSTGGTFDHVISTNIGTLGIEPMIGRILFANIHLYAGGRVAAMLGTTYEQKETISQPQDGVTFLDGTKMRNQFTGDLPEITPVSVALLAGVNAEFPLNASRTLFMAPEVFFVYGLTRIVHDTTWHANTLRIGIALYNSPRETPTPPPVPVPHRPVLNASVHAFGVDSSMTELPVAKIRVEEFLSTQLRPLLNYVFFEEGSAELQGRYTTLSPESAQGFQVDDLRHSETLPTYYHLLNIVGRRLIEHPEATITLVGCNAGIGSEKGDVALSKRRAETVRAYLQTVWNIPDSRIRMEYRNLSSRPSTPIAEPDKIVENRRVEIQSDTWQIIEPVSTNDTLRTANPPIIRFRPTIHAEAGRRSWELTASESDNTLKGFAGTDSLSEKIDWDLNSDSEALRKLTQSLEYKLDASDSIGQTTGATGSLPIEQLTIRKKRRERIADKEIDRYSLILFDFDKAELNQTNNRIGDLIRGRLAPNATVTITGYTDRTGDAEYNRKLSEGRARSTYANLRFRNATYTGLGESTLLFDNDLPEGRFYSRTVNILVETPVNEP